MSDLPEDDQELLDAAEEVMEQAYAPYSEFRVGAAARTDDGTIYQGCNVENASYGLTNCAERTAMFNGVSEGDRKFTAIAIVIDTNQGVGAPCGACRQVMNEFNAEMKVIMANTAGDIEQASLQDLLPQSFGANYLTIEPEDIPREYVDKKAVGSDE